MLDKLENSDKFGQSSSLDRPKTSTSFNPISQRSGNNSRFERFNVSINNSRAQSVDVSKPEGNPRNKKNPNQGDLIQKFVTNRIKTASRKEPFNNTPTGGYRHFRPVKLLRLEQVRH